MDKAKLAKVVRDAQNGNDKALETLYLEYAKRTYYLALKIMRNKEDAEDITQEVFITVCQKIGELKEPEAFGLWLNRITANKCTNTFKKKVRFSEQDISEFDETEFADFLTETDPLLLPEKSLDNAETSRMIVDIIDALPDVQRLCVYYYYYEQMTIAQIAEILESNENTIKKRLYLARNKIRKELERLNSEEGTKLYSLVPLMLTPLLKFSLQNFEMPGIGELWNSITAATANAAPVVAASTVKGAFIMGIKAKIAIGVTGVLLVGGIIAGVILSGNTDNKNDSGNRDRQTSSSTTNSRNVTESPIVTESPANEPGTNGNDYGDSLVPLFGIDNRNPDVDGKIIDVLRYSSFFTVVLTDNNKLYNLKDNEYSYIGEVNAGASRLNGRIMGRNVAIENVDGTYSFYGINSTLTDEQYVYGSEIGVRYENIEVNGYVNAGIGYGGGSRLTVYALNDSMLHIIRYEDEDTNAVTNEPLFIRRGGRSDDEFFYRDGVKEIYTWSDSEGTSYALLSDGSLHFLDSLGGIKFHPSDSQKGIFSAYTVTAEPYLSGVNRLFGNRYANFGVMYTLSDDDGNLYVGKRVDRNADYFKVELPAVYTDMDIKSVYSVDGSGKDIIVEFNDGNIYFTQNAESGEELTHHEELSRLNTENRILRIEAYDRNLFIVLCDDGNLYKLDLTRSLLATGSGSTSTTNPNPPSTLLGNVIGNSDVATDGKNDYYIGKTNGQQMLIKEELSSGKKEILFYTANLHIKNINIINDRLYFSCYETVSPHLNGIYTMKTDGTEGSFIYNGELTIRKMVVVGDYLYFTYGSSDVHLYSMKNDGSELKQLEKTNYFDVLEDGSIDTQAKALGNTEQRIESGGWIYFKNADDKYNIYKMRSDGSEITYLSDGGWDINVVGDRVYYSLVHLHRVRTDGSKDEIVFENDMFITDLPDFQYILEY